MMYEYVEIDGGFEVTDEDGRAAATCQVEADAREIVAALNLVNALAEQEVAGADLVDFITERIAWEEDGRFHEPDMEKDDGDAVEEARRLLDTAGDAPDAATLDHLENLYQLVGHEDDCNRKVGNG